MKTVRRLLYSDIVGSVGFVALAFLSLFFFIDFVEELADVGKRSNYTTRILSNLEAKGKAFTRQQVTTSSPGATSTWTWPRPFLRSSTPK